MKTTTNLLQVTDELYHTQLHLVGIDLTTLLEMGNECLNRCKLNYGTIASTSSSIIYYQSLITSTINDDNVYQLE